MAVSAAAHSEQRKKSIKDKQKKQTAGQFAFLKKANKKKRVLFFFLNRKSKQPHRLQLAKRAMGK
jgi:predicted secreted acid phosphatase